MFETPFQFLHPSGLRDGAPEAREQMHMVLHAADEDGRTIELFGDAAEIRMERVARGFVAQQRTAVFGGENEMNVNGGKGLRHGGRMPNRNRFASVNMMDGSAIRSSGGAAESKRVRV
jgi:hypothetical protein